MAAGAGADLLQELEESVSCAICLESLKDPRSLPCQHSFCMDCLQGVLGQGQELPCPICKHVVYVPTGTGVWELPKDFRANTWLEKLSDYQKVSEIAATKAREEEARDKDVQRVPGDWVSVEPCPTCDQPPSHRLFGDCLRFCLPRSRDRVNFTACSCQTTALPMLHSDPGPSSLSGPPEAVHEESRLTFDPRCGSNVAVHANQLTAHINNEYSASKPSIILTSRHLKPNEIFEVRLEKKIKIYVGSIIIGVTTHSARHLDFPPYLSNIRSGTWICSGEQVLKNGKITNSQYGQDLDMIEVGGRVGVQRRDDGTLHLYINGVDQGVAASGVPPAVYGAIDLFGNAQQVTIVDSSGDNPEERQLTFHPRCGAEAVVHANLITAHRNNPLHVFSDAVVLTSRHLKVDELFEIRLDKKVRKWEGSVVIGVTTRSPLELEFPSCIGDILPGTLMVSRGVVTRNGVPIKEKYGKDLDTLKEGDRIGVRRKKKGNVHFYINGVDQGVAAGKIPAAVYGAIDLHGEAVQATIMDTTGLLDDSREDGNRCSIS